MSTRHVFLVWLVVACVTYYFREKKLKQDGYLAAYATYEMAMLQMDMNKLSEAETLLSRAK